MSVNHAKEFFKYILYFKTFLAEPHMAHITPILKKKISNLKFISFFIYIFRKSLSNIGPREVDPLYYIVGSKKYKTNLSDFIYDSKIIDNLKTF